MAEAAASVITLAGLYKVCVEAFNLFCCVKNQDVELKRLSLKLSTERCRLLVWGQSMGLSSDDARNSFGECAFPEVVENTLGEILELLTDSRSLASRYGCRLLDHSIDDARLVEEEADTPAGKFNTAFDKIKHGLSSHILGSRAAQTTSWAIHDRKRFGLLVNEAREMIDGLQEITEHVVSKRKQDRLMTSRIISIHDQETLSMISEVCDSDHPAFSDAASCRFDAMTMAPSMERDVLDWSDRIRPTDDTYHLLQDMEDWTLRDYRQNFLDLYRESGKEWRPPPAVFPCHDCGIALPTQADCDQHVDKELSHCSFCHTNFDCHGLMMEHGCWSRRKRDDAGVADLERGGPLEFEYSESYLKDIKPRLSVTLPNSLLHASVRVAAIEELGKTQKEPEYANASDTQTIISDESELALHSDEMFSPVSGPGLSLTISNHNDLKHIATTGELVTTEQLPANIKLDSTRRFSSIGVQGGALFECLDCGKRFTNDRDWDFHISRERRRCVDCDRLFECYERFLEHTPNCEPKAATASTLSH